MPLVRFQVRNEFRLGQPELYRDANKEDPKAILDGVAVSGLVGILRQLGDLAEFAAEVFHGLQEQVMTTSSRSHKLMVRVQNIEASFPPLEKAILAQTSHIHFAYTVGSEWHPHIQNGSNHFIYNDLPRFIMNSYEECQDPPRLHMLDKFDTGGPGSCLKRYSDPTFFRRISANSDEGNAEKVRRYKKARKRMKKRLSQSNGDVSCASNLLNQSGRIQFSSQNVEGRTSSQTASPSDLTFKSDMGDRSNSFDSRTGLSSIEYMFHPSFFMQPEGTESGKSSFRMMQHNGISDSVFSGEQTEAAGNDFRSPLKEKIEPRSSSVTWDEKAEIVNTKGHQECDRDEAPVVLPIHSDLDMANETETNLTNVDQTEILFDDDNTATSTSSKHERDDFESEPDNYMDALNTIEVESDTDFECQTKREVEEYSKNNMVSVEDQMDKLSDQHTDLHPSKDECHNEPDIFLDRETSLDIPNSVSSLCNDEQAPQISGFSTSVHSHSNDLCGNADIPDSLGSVGDPSSSGSKTDMPDPPDGNMIRNFPEVQQSPAEHSGVRFWTNGSLLGLEPSKPPDFSLSIPSSMMKGDGYAGKLGMEVKNAGILESNLSKIFPSCQYYEGEGKITKSTSVVLLTSEVNEKLEKSDDSHRNSKLGGPHEGDPNKINAREPETEHQSYENEDNSSRVFGLRHKLLVNGFREKLSLVNDDKPEQASTRATWVSEQSRLHCVPYQTIKKTTFKEQFEHGSPLDSLTSSPPLEHMKISFHPINVFETSKLQLKFPGRSDCRESSCLMFPSFQLVPESAVPLPDIVYDSDDDLFCRSSPYLSEDCLSNCSESNSEQWESSDIPRSKEQGLYDALGTVASMEFVSNSLGISGTATNRIPGNGGIADISTVNGLIPSCMSDLSSSYSMNPVQQDTENDYHWENSIELQNPVLFTPFPPPLPPVQWREKTHMVEADDKQEHTANESSHDAFDSEQLGSAVSRSMLGSANEQESNEHFIVLVPKSKQQELLKSNGQNEDSLTANPKVLCPKKDFVPQITNGVQYSLTANPKVLCPKKDFVPQITNGQHELQKLDGQCEANLVSIENGVDERQDFLHQIKTKSFNLRHTETARPAYTPGSVTNIKVNAILEKANAIRQAVGGDNDEDDNWSDA